MYMLINVPMFPCTHYPSCLTPSASSQHNGGIKIQLWTTAMQWRHILTAPPWFNVWVQIHLCNINIIYSIYIYIFMFQIICIDVCMCIYIYIFIQYTCIYMYIYVCVYAYSVFFIYRDHSRKCKEMPVYVLVYAVLLSFNFEEIGLVTVGELKTPDLSRAPLDR